MKRFWDGCVWEWGIPPNYGHINREHDDESVNRQAPMNHLSQWILPSLLGIMMLHRETALNQLVYDMRWENGCISHGSLHILCWYCFDIYVWMKKIPLLRSRPGHRWPNHHFLSSRIPILIVNCYWSSSIPIVWEWTKFHCQTREFIANFVEQNPLLCVFFCQCLLFISNHM